MHSGHNCERERGRERREEGRVEGRERRFYSWHVGVNAVLCVVCGTVYIAIHNYVGVSSCHYTMGLCG